MEIERQGVEYWLLKKTIKGEKAVADAEIEEYRQWQWKAYHTCNKEFDKCEKYCRVELKRGIDRTLNRDLEALCAKVAKVQPRLPDGRYLLFHMQEAAVIPLLDAQEKAVA